MRTTILLTTLGLTIGFAGTAFADDSRGRRDHNERAGQGRSHDETTERANRPGHGTRHIESTERRAGHNESSHSRQAPTATTRGSKRM
jgi:hypothetical protein